MGYICPTYETILQKWISFSPFRGDDAKFRLDLLNIAQTTLSSKILSQHKDLFANMAVDAVMRLRESGNLEHIQIIKKIGGQLSDSFLDEGRVKGESSFQLLLCSTVVFCIGFHGLCLPVFLGLILGSLTDADSIVLSYF